MAQAGTPGRGRRRAQQAPFGSDLGFGNAAQQGVESSLTGLDTAFPADQNPPLTHGEQVFLPSRQDPSDISLGTALDQSTVVNPETVVDPGTISAIDPIFDTSSQGVEQILGQETALFNPLQGFGSNKRGRSGLGGGSSIRGGK